MFDSNNLSFDQAEELNITDYPNLEEIIALGENNIKNITKVTIRNCSQLREVNITNFTDNHGLEKINCGSNQLINLNLSSLIQLKNLYCRDNFLTDIIYPSNPEKLTELSIRNNNFSESDLSIFSPFANLETLYVGNDEPKKITKNI